MILGFMLSVSIAALFLLPKDAPRGGMIGH